MKGFVFIKYMKSLTAILLDVTLLDSCSVGSCSVAFLCSRLSYALPTSYIYSFRHFSDSYDYIPLTPLFFLFEDYFIVNCLVFCFRTPGTERLKAEFGVSA